jgi:ribose transport system substrate-binding protein
MTAPIPTRAKTGLPGPASLRRAMAAAVITAAAAAALVSPASTASAASNSKLIIFTLPFPCNLNSYAEGVCKGVAFEAKELAAHGFTVETKTGSNYADVTAYNNLLETSYGLGPGGVIAFVNGPAAQTPTLLQACAKGIKVILIDSPATGMGKCQSSFIGSNHYQMGVEDGKYLIAHPPANHSKQVGVVTQPPGEYASTDARVRGFETTVRAAGYKIVSTVITNLELTQTRDEVTNMLTAHPNIGAIFAANGPMGDGTLEALGGHPQVELLTLDGDTLGIEGLQKGTVAADTVQDPFGEATMAVRYMSEVLLGQTVPKMTYTPSEVLTKANVASFITAGGPQYGGMPPSASA